MPSVYLCHYQAHVYSSMHRLCMAAAVGYIDGADTQHQSVPRCNRLTTPLHRSAYMSPQDAARCRAPCCCWRWLHLFDLSRDILHTCYIDNIKGYNIMRLHALSKAALYCRIITMKLLSVIQDFDRPISKCWTSYTYRHLETIKHCYVILFTSVFIYFEYVLCATCVAYVYILICERLKLPAFTFNKIIYMQWNINYVAISK